MAQRSMRSRSQSLRAKSPRVCLQVVAHSNLPPTLRMRSPKSMHAEQGDMHVRTRGSGGRPTVSPGGCKRKADRKNPHSRTAKAVATFRASDDRAGRRRLPCQAGGHRSVPDPCVHARAHGPPTWARASIPIPCIDLRCACAKLAAGWSEPRPQRGTRGLLARNN